MTSAFGDGAKDAIAWIEKVWNVDADYRIRIEDVKKPLAGYAANISREVGGRAYVDREKFTMELFNFGRLRTIPHEFGHILGFADNYFTLWNKKTCGYDVEINPGDLMSDSTAGVVLPEHWEQLKKTYWKK